MVKKSRSKGKDQFKALVDLKAKQLRSSQIPTDEDFARADALMAARERKFAVVRDKVLRSFAGQIPLHDIFLFCGPATDYDAYVFYESTADMEACRANGAEQAIREAICQGFAEFSEHGTQPTVTFNFDSHENVKRQCNGNYDKYLR